MVPAPIGSAAWVQDQPSPATLVTRGSDCTEQVCSCTVPDRLSPWPPWVTVTSSGPSGANVQAGFGGTQGLPVVTGGRDCTPELETARRTGLATPLLPAASGLLVPVAGGAAKARICPVPLTAN